MVEFQWGGDEFSSNSIMILSWWGMPVIPPLQRLRKKDHWVEDSLGYMVRPCRKAKQTK
jgi:hypothetical protein